ncbi:MAG: amidohydrolase family protein [Thermoanaerobaculia bacterium]
MRRAASSPTMSAARNVRMALTAALAVANLACGAAVEEPATAEAGTLIRGAALVETDRARISEPQDVLVVDGTIREMAAAGALRPGSGTEIVDGTGLFLLPGLIDVHAHLGNGGIARQGESDRIGALDQFVRYGVTTIFVPGGSAGNDEQLGEWKRRCASGELRCPRVLGSGDLITAPGSHPITTIFGLPADADAALLHPLGVTALAESEPAEPLVARKVAAGVDAIKVVIEDGPPPWYPKPRLSTGKAREIVTAAHARNLRVFAHISDGGQAADAVDAGVDALMHSARTPIPEATLAEMARRKVSYVATLSLHDGLMDDALGRFQEEPYAELGVPAEVLDGLRNAPHGPRRISDEDLAGWKADLATILLQVRDAGAPLALGTDTNNPTVFPGYAVHEELALLVEAGLTPAEALAAATTGGAAMLGREDDLGRIAPGYRADLVALRGDPLLDVLATRRLAFVMAAGEIQRDVVSVDGAVPE